MLLQQLLQDTDETHVKGEDDHLMVKQDQDQGPPPDPVDHAPLGGQEDQEHDMAGPHHLLVRQAELTSLRLEGPTD